MASPFDGRPLRHRPDDRGSAGARLSVFAAPPSVPLEDFRPSVLGRAHFLRLPRLFQRHSGQKKGKRVARTDAACLKIQTGGRRPERPAEKAADGKPEGIPVFLLSQLQAASSRPQGQGKDQHHLPEMQSQLHQEILEQRRRRMRRLFRVPRRLSRDFTAPPRSVRFSPPGGNARGVFALSFP